MYDRTTTPEQEARGFLAESRFFTYVNYTRHPFVRGFVRVEQASALMDARGIDGFVHHYRRGTSSTPKRIPIQLKTGFAYGSDGCHTTRNDLRVPIIPISVDMRPQSMLDQIRRLLDAFDASPKEYEVKLCAIEHWQPSCVELQLADLIERSRERFKAPPLKASVDHAFETA